MCWKLYFDIAKISESAKQNTGVLKHVNFTSNLTISLRFEEQLVHVLYGIDLCLLW
jgi:hypothetical protein